MIHDTRPIIGLQWHPERMCLSHRRADTVDGLPIFDYFLKVIRGEEMYTDMRIRNFGFLPGTMTPGPGNSITDVPGVTVGQTTHAEGDLHTGVTVVIPASRQSFFQ